MKITPFGYPLTFYEIAWQVFEHAYFLTAVHDIVNKTAGCGEF